MTSSDASYVIGKLRKSILALGIVTGILAYFSHFESAWALKSCDPETNECFASYQMCDIPTAKKCPKLFMEHYFVAVVFICFGLSVCSVALDFFLSKNIKAMRPYKLMNTGYHTISMGFLISAAVVYFISAKQINDLFPYEKALDYNFRHKEKLAAAGLTLVQAGLYGITAMLICCS